MNVKQNWTKSSKVAQSGTMLSLQLHVLRGIGIIYFFALATP